jgi:hypothetical protein
VQTLVMSTYCQYRMGKRGPLGRESGAFHVTMYLVSSTRRRGSTHPGTVQNTPDAILGDFAMG